MSAPKVTPLPPPPNAQTAAGEFSNRADEFLGALPVFGSQMNDVSAFVSEKADAAAGSGDNADRAEIAAQTATAAAAAAGSSAGLPAMTGRGRRPLAVNREGTGVLYSDVISVASYIDRSVRNNAATGSVTLNLAAASVFDLTLAGNATLAVSGVPPLAGETLSFVVRIRQGATARTLTWWAGITWLSPSAPPAPARDKIKEYVLSYDGSSWIGREGAEN